MSGPNGPFSLGGYVNYVQLCQRLNLEAGLQGAETRPTSVLNQTGMMYRLVKWVAEEWVNIQAQRDWEFLRTSLSFNTVVGQRDYTSSDVPAYGNVRRLDNFAQVTDSSSNILPMIPLAYPQFRMQFERTAAASGVPLYYTQAPGPIIRMNTLPDAAYPVRIDAYRAPIVLTNNTDTPAIPDSDHMVIVWGALMKYALQDSQQELFQHAQMNYNRMISNLVKTQTYSASKMAEPLA